MAYHYDEKKQKYVYDNEKQEEEAQKDIGEQNRNLIADKYHQHKQLKGSMEKKFGRLWWLWGAIGIGMLSKVVKYVQNILENL